MAANEKDTADLNAMAFDIFKERVSAGAPKRGIENEAILSFKLAEAFLKVRVSVARGEIKPTRDAEKPVLCDVSAKNLKVTHPHNLVSQRFGNLDRVAKIKAWLDAHPTPEKDPEELVTELNYEFADLGWDLAAVNVARAIFPTYAK